MQLSVGLPCQCPMREVHRQALQLHMIYTQWFQIYKHYLEVIQLK